MRTSLACKARTGKCRSLRAALLGSLLPSRSISTLAKNPGLSSRLGGNTAPHHPLVCVRKPECAANPTSDPARGGPGGVAGSGLGSGGVASSGSGSGRALLPDRVWVRAVFAFLAVGGLAWGAAFCLCLGGFRA